MNILVVDGQGGAMGRQLVEQIKKSCNENVIAVGTNSMATAAMLKAGADEVATGENAVVVASKDADVIIGPIGIVIADSLMGEITATMATAIGQSRAVKLLLPINHCKNMIIGVEDLSITQLIKKTIAQLKELV